MSNAIKYRPEIDGLRAIAVMAVIFFHLHFGGVTGGYIGVDVFFVISGYLITGIILKDCESGSFSLLHFYQRRIRRILPLALVVCFLSFCAAYTFYDKLTYGSNTHVLKRSLLFISNFLIADKQNYFAPQAYDLLFLHSWSLSIEEQFYILFPLLFILLYKYANKKYKSIWIVLTTLSFIFNVIYVYIDPKYTFYSPFARAWELMAGAILAMGESKVKLSEKRKNWLPYLATAMLVTGFFMYNNSIAYPGAYALLPVSATILLIYSLKDSKTYVYKVLTFKPVVFTGTISYSLYMWHYPLFILASSLYLEDVPFVVKWCLLVVLFLLSICSYYFIERPFRTGYFKPTMAFAIIAISWIGVYVTIKLSADNRNSRFGKENYRFTYEEEKIQTFLAKHQAKGIDTAYLSGFKVYHIGCTDKVPCMLIYGDSHAAVLAYGLDNLAKQKGISLYVIVRPGYPPLLGVHRQASDTKIINAYIHVLQFIRSHNELKTIILSARWSAYCGELKRPNNKLVIEQNIYGKNYLQDSLLILGVTNIADTFCKMNRKVVITTPVPELRSNVYKMIAIRTFRRKPYEYFSYSHEEYIKQNKFFLTFLSQLEEQNKVVIIDVAKQLLGNNNYKIVSDGHPIYSDNNHLSSSGSTLAANAFENMFKNIK